MRPNSSPHADAVANANRNTGVLMRTSFSRGMPWGATARYRDPDGNVASLTQI